MSLRPLFDAVDALDPSRGLLVGLDYDGTLCPAATRPVPLSQAAKSLLDRLTRQGRTHVAVVAGRSVPDLRRLVGLDAVHYAGDYGYAISGPLLKWRHRTAAAAKAELSELAKRIRRDLAFEDVVVEKKDLSVSVHYRLAAPADHEPLRRRLFELVHVAARRFRVYPGCMTWEVRPLARWSKAHALELIAERLDYPQIVFVGDAAIDEEAFQKLGPEALTVRVGGAAPTAARFRVKGPPDVRALLARLCRFPAPIR